MAWARSLRWLPDKTPTSMKHSQICRNLSKSDVAFTIRRVGVSKTRTSRRQFDTSYGRPTDVEKSLVNQSTFFPAKIPTALRQSNLVEIDVALATSYQRLYNVENRRRYRRPFVTSYWRPRDVEKLTVIYAPKLRPLIDESTLLA